MSVQLDADTVCSLVVCGLCGGPQVAPRLLPCLHSFCGPCLERRHHRRSMGAPLVCPMCSTDLHGMSDKGEYDTNLLAAMLRDSHEKIFKKASKVCSRCEEEKTGEKKARFWCPVCRAFLCDACNRNHNADSRKADVNDAPRHNVVALEGLKRKVSLRYSRRKNKEYCEKHGKESVKVYCVTCMVPMCITCKVTIHADHKTLSIQDAADGHRAAIRPLLPPIRTKMDDVKDALTTWGQYQHDLNAKESELVASVDSYRDELIRMIDSWHQQCITTLRRSCDRESKVIHAKMAGLENAKESIGMADTFSQTLVKHGKDAQVAYLQGSVTRQLSRLADLTVTRPEDRLKLSFTRWPDIITPQALGAIKVEQEGSGSDSTSAHLDRTLSLQSLDSPVFTFKAHCLTDQSEPWLTGVTVTPGDDPQVIVADHRNNALKFFTSVGQLKRTIYLSDLSRPGHQSAPSKALWDCGVLANGDLALACEDGLYILNTLHDRCMAIDPNNSYTSVAVGTDNKVVTFNDTLGQVNVYNAESHTMMSAFSVYNKRVLGWISTVAMDTRGRVLLTDVTKDSVKVYSASGKVLQEFGEHGKGQGQFIRPRGISVDGNGSLLVADKGNNRVQAFTADGAYQRTVMSRKQNLDTPAGVAVDTNGKVVIVTEKGLVHILKPDVT